MPLLLSAPTSKKNARSLSMQGACVAAVFYWDSPMRSVSSFNTADSLTSNHADICIFSIAWIFHFVNIIFPIVWIFFSFFILLAVIGRHGPQKTLTYPHKPRSPPPPAGGSLLCRAADPAPTRTTHNTLSPSYSYKALDFSLIIPRAPRPRRGALSSAGRQTPLQHTQHTFTIIFI